MTGAGGGGAQPPPSCVFGHVPVVAFAFEALPSSNPPLRSLKKPSSSPFEAFVLTFEAFVLTLQKTKVPNVFLDKGLSAQKQTATRKRFWGLKNEKKKESKK